MSPVHSPDETTIHYAMVESVTAADTLLSMAQQAEQERTSEAITITRSWTPSARTYTYHTHVQVGCADSTVLSKVVDCFFYAATLDVQPWYSQFLRGKTLSISPARGSARALLCVPEFDFGMGKTHSYRQLLNDFSPSECCHVLVLRSVIHALKFPLNTVPAFTLAPTGDVFHWQEGILHWHHICTVSGVGIMPSGIERYVMNALRWLHLDMAERKTYREEAESFMRWVSDPGHVNVTWQSIAAFSANHQEEVTV
jgi:hypothetical protein